MKNFAISQKYYSKGSNPNTDWNNPDSISPTPMSLMNLSLFTHWHKREENQARNTVTAII